MYAYVLSNALEWNKIKSLVIFISVKKEIFEKFVIKIKTYVPKFGQYLDRF